MIDGRHNPLVAKLSQFAPLSNNDISVLETLCRKNASALAPTSWSRVKRRARRLFSLGGWRAVSA
jgi:hypothetical protein